MRCPDVAPGVLPCQPALAYPDLDMRGCPTPATALCRWPNGAPSQKSGPEGASAHSTHAPVLIACRAICRTMRKTDHSSAEKVARPHSPHGYVTTKQHLHAIAVALAEHRANCPPSSARSAERRSAPGSRRWPRASDRFPGDSHPCASGLSSPSCSSPLPVPAQTPRSSPSTRGLYLALRLHQPHRVAL